MMDAVLPNTQLHMSQSATIKLRRTELGRSLISSDSVIVDRIKFDPDDADRIWIGVRKTAIDQPKHRSLTAVIDDETFETLERAINGSSQYTLAAFAQRLYDSFRAHRKTCLFIQEPTE